MSDFLSRHATAVRSGDLDAVAALYADDARLLTLSDAHDGRDAVRERFAGFFEYHGTIDALDVEHQQASGSEAFVSYTLQSERGRFTLLNAFVLDGDVCRVHFSNETEVALNRDEVEG